MVRGENALSVTALLLLLLHILGAADQKRDAINVWIPYLVVKMEGQSVDRAANEISRLTGLGEFLRGVLVFFNDGDDSEDDKDVYSFHLP